MTYTGVQDQTIRPRTKRWSDSTWLKAIFAELRRTTSSRAQSEHGWRTFDSKPLDVAGGRATALRQRNDDSKQRRRRSGRRRPAEPPPAGWQGAESHCALRFHEKYTHLSEISDPPCKVYTYVLLLPRVNSEWPRQPTKFFLADQSASTHV